MALPVERSIAPPTRGGPTDPSHDVDLRRGIIHTAVSRRLALVLVATFLLVIYGVPITQAVMEKVKDEDSMLLELFKRAPTRENLKRYEDDLEKASYPKEHVQPRVQLLLSRLGAGNKRAVIGREGWLYYGPGVLALAGPGFLDPEAQRVRIRAAVDAEEPPLYPDPRPAVLALHQALKSRGIQLVLFPVPDKAAVQPAQLHGRKRAAIGAIGANLDQARFVAEMRAAGVLVFEPALPRPDELPRFLIQDTHWTPASMEQVAGELAGFIGKQVTLPPWPARARKAVAQRAERVGDIVDMLKLPDEQTLFRPQAVTVHKVQEGEESWQPRAGADVLLMGDSFTNVFSLDAMGWGEAAGLAPHLALALGRDLDVIAQNDSGAFATRKLLSEALVAGEDRLAGKRVVIWELAARELAVGNWRPFDYQVKR